MNVGANLIRPACRSIEGGRTLGIIAATEHVARVKETGKNRLTCLCLKSILLSLALPFTHRTKQRQQHRP